MGHRMRNYVPPSGEMFRAVAYDADGLAVAATGPYSTRAAAMGSRRNIARRGRRVLVEVCRPAWEPVPGTEMAT